MNYELLEALNQIAREKNVDRDVLVETLIAGLLSAARRRYGLSANIDVHFDRDRGMIEAKLIRRVVGTVQDPALEISLEEAREQDPNATPGQEHHRDLDVQEFGRNAVSTAKQVLVQRVREAERERVYADFHDRVGELIHGVVQQVDRRSVLLRVDGVESVLPEREALHRDRFRQGDHVTAMLLDVDRMSKGPQVVLTRSHPDFLRRLFESEVPEIAERIVEVRSIAREAGSRSKVAVVSHDDRVDAVGACVGVKGSRVQNIVRELGGERIDIVPWSQDPALFVTRALSPARVQRVDVDEETGGVTVVVPEDQLSLAIGKGGQNVRLAMKLTGWSIELISEEQLAEQRELDEVADFDIEDIVKELGPKLTERLIQAGLETARDVMNATPETLQSIEGVGPKSAEKVIAVVSVLYEERHEQFRKEREEAEAAARAQAIAEAQAEEAEAAAAAEAEVAAEAVIDEEAVTDEEAATDAEAATDEEATTDEEAATDEEARETEATDAGPPATVEGDVDAPEPAAAGDDEDSENEENERPEARSETDAEPEPSPDEEVDGTRRKDGGQTPVTAVSARKDADDDTRDGRA